MSGNVEAYYRSNYGNNVSTPAKAELRVHVAESPDLQRAIADWAIETFGEARFKSIWNRVAKLEEEETEFLEAYRDANREAMIAELGDLFICCFGLASALGVDGIELTRATLAKLKDRIYELQPDGSYTKSDR